MNRAKLAGTGSTSESTLQSGKRGRRRSKIKDTENDSQIDDSDEFSDADEELLNGRKSKRIQKQMPGNKPGTKTIKFHDSKLTAGFSVDRKQLNGAQFVAAAAAGNFNVSASIGSTSITIDSNANVDLNQLNQNVEILNSSLKQHSVFLKQLNSSIERLSDRLGVKEKASGEAKRSLKKAPNRRLKKQPLAQSDEPSVTNEDQRQLHRQPTEQRCTSATDDCDVFEDELDQTETIKVPSHCDKDTEKADTDSVFNEIESINRLDLIEDAASAASLELTNFKNLVFDQNNANGTEVGPAVRLEEVGSNEKELANSMSQQEEEQQPQQLVKNELQTVKLTNAGLDMEKSMQIQSNIAYYSSDSCDEEAEEDEETRGGDGSHKSYASSSKSFSGTKAILNKTKIDTEFISKLIENKDPNDKRYDPNEINKLRLLSHSYQNFAVKLLIRLFDEEEIIGRNVYGRNYSGDKTFFKQSLDTERINFIKETVLRLTRTNNPELAWASCVIAMNRKMVDINNKFIKQNSKK